MSTTETPDRMSPDPRTDATAEESGSAAQRERRKRILDATIALASSGGFDAVQMRAVAEQADVALGTLYRYFPSKIHLLVSALGREFEDAERAGRGRPINGDTPHERVMSLLRGTTRSLQRDPHLTEALTRAFMFADASVKDEIHVVGMLLTSMLTRAITDEARGGQPGSGQPGSGQPGSGRAGDPQEPTDEDVQIARVIGDVWLSALVGWVTGRMSTADIDDHMDVAVRLLLR